METCEGTMIWDHHQWTYRIESRGDNAVRSPSGYSKSGLSGLGPRLRVVGITGVVCTPTHLELRHYLTEASSTGP